MKPNKAITMILALMMLVAPLLVVVPVYAANPVYISVEPTPTAPLTDIDPSPYILETPSTPSPVGEEFTVEVHLRNATVTNVALGVGGIEIHFYFGNILSYAVPTGFTNMLGAVGGALNAPLLYGVDAAFYNITGGKVLNPPYTGAIYYKVAAASTGGGWNGADGVIVKITFDIIDQPQSMLSEPTVTLALDNDFTDVADSLANPVSHDIVQGSLVIDTAPPQYPARPKIFVDPPTYTGVNVGDNFNIDVKIGAEGGGGVDALWDVAGFDITFEYDENLITLISATEGGFLQQFATPTFGWIDTSVAGVVWAVFTKLANPTPSSGIDTLISMTFQVAYQATTYPPNSTALALTDTNLASWAHPERIFQPWNSLPTAVELPYDPNPIPPAFNWTHVRQDGMYTAPYLAEGPAIDVYTQYPAPYGGQGPFEHSDAFAPQQLVCLYAKVTYGGDRVTNKLVIFEIHDALGNKITLLQNYSDINGIAKVCFRIPQTDLIPGGEDPSIFGWWFVIATVELDEVVVNDTLWFQVGWLAQVLSVFPENAPYLKYSDYMNFTVTVKTIFEQGLWALISADAYDVQNYPIGEVAWWAWLNATRVSGNPGNTTGGIYVWNNVLMSIPSWARVGLAWSTGYAMTDWPRYGGTAYGPQALPQTFQIKLS